MRIEPVNLLKVGIVPSWLNECIASSYAIDPVPLKDRLDPTRLKDCVSLNSLWPSILNDRELKIFILVQREMKNHLPGLFDDLDSILSTEENAPVVAKFESGLSALYEELCLNKKAKVGNAAMGTDFHPLDKEFYLPQMVGENHLLLIGSREPVFKDRRAFLNATIEALAQGGIRYDTFRRFIVFKEYLKHAIDN